jgi:lysophospholipase L1-like esterase
MGQERTVLHLTRCLSGLTRCAVARSVIALSALTLSYFAVACGGAAPATPPPAALPAPSVPPEPVAPPEPEPRLRADLAAPPLAGGANADEWQARHEALLRAPGRSAAQLVLLGDSLAEGWFSSRAFKKQWGKHKPLNLAQDGDQTQQVLWRAEHGALEGLSPRLVIVSVGSENLTHGFSAAETARGVSAVLARIAEQLPASQILLLALLPRGATATDPLRVVGDATNAELRRLGSNQVTLVEPGAVFLENDGSLTPDVMADDVHLTALGYEALTMSVSLVAQDLLKKSR